MQVLVVNLCALASVCAMSAFSPNFRVFLLFRFIIGCFVGGVNTVWAVFIIENLPRAHRFWLCTLITWAPNYVVLAFIAYITAEWRILAFICALLSLPGILLLIFVIHESPHYLLQKGRLKEAIDVLTAITSWNNEPISSREIAELVAWEASKKNTAKTAITIKQNTYLDLYRTRTLAVHTIVTSFGFVAANCVTYSLVFNLSIIEGSLYVNTALSGALRYAIGIAIAVIDYTCVCAGRKIIHVGSVAVIVACLGGIVSLLHYELADIHGNLIRMFTLTSFGMTGSIFTQLSLISAELFPTPLRNLANAHGNVFSRVGSVVAPSIFELAIISPSAPYLLLTFISVIEILAILWGIPETKNKHLSDVTCERDYE
uniref:Major facilitator superfamily (MFS) profile domain-containing protein n=1 Tax=Parascaris univalens TaxID=6257 RepID=A0A915C0I3_PARUN